MNGNIKRVAAALALGLVVVGTYSLRPALAASGPNTPGTPVPSAAPAAELTAPANTDQEIKSPADQDTDQIEEQVGDQSGPDLNEEKAGDVEKKNSDADQVEHESQTEADSNAD
ncbi:MAG: hypothetical protein ACYC5Y_13135 [Symbiobacteriia bacterium]